MINQPQEKKLLNAEGLPILQNRVFETAKEAQQCARVNMQLVENQQTGLIYNAAFTPETITYGPDYQNEQGLSPAFDQHLNQIAARLHKRFRNQKIVEIGCGKGTFVEKLSDLGANIQGMDPAYEGDNPLIKKTFFDPDEPINADCIILRHVLEHIQNPLEFLRQLAKANANQGSIYIEVPAFEWIVKNHAWFDIFYEHVNYFRRDDFHRMFDQVVESGYVFANQYLFVLADLASLRQKIAPPITPFELPNNFTATIEIQAEKIKANPVIKHGLWGASSKGVIFALNMLQRGADIDAVFDINPAKQHKHLPITGLQVHPDSEHSRLLPVGSKLFVANPNYLEEIKVMTNHRYHYETI